MTATTERRLEVLKLAREYNFLILEGEETFEVSDLLSLMYGDFAHSDDPYFYLYFGKAERPQSYFSLEASEPEVGRVLRFDSVSKILSAGIRIGFVSGPTPVVRAMDLHVSLSRTSYFSLSSSRCSRLYRPPTLTSKRPP